MTQRPPSADDLSAFSALAPELARTLVAIAGDIALVVDPGGVISSVALGESRFPASVGDWVGRAWADTVTGDTRRKIELMLQEVGETGLSRRREVNLASENGPGIPVSYAAVRLGADGPLLAIGRDLRAIAAIQQRFVESQQEMEREYWKKRQAESRYRMLFQVATDAVMVVDGLTLQIVEANPATARMFGLPLEALNGQPAAGAVHPGSRAGLEEMLVAARSTGRPAEIPARLADRPETISISATPFRAESTMLLLVRARSADAKRSSGESWVLSDFVERTPDAIVITDSSGRVMIANPAFVAMCQLTGDAEWRHRSLGDWMTSPGRDLDALLAHVRRRGINAQMSATVRGARGALTDVELSAALIEEGDQEAIGFTLRRIPQAASTSEAGSPDDAAQVAIEALARRIGHAPLDELLRSGHALVERLLLVAALQKSAGNLHGAASLLELSLPELDQRMRRHGLGAGTAEDDDAAEAPPGLLN